MNSLVNAHEFFGQMQAAHEAFRLLNTNISTDQALFRGTFQKTRIRDGLSVHYSDVTNLCDLRTKTEAPPHLGIKLFFQGGVAASIGSVRIPMPDRQADGTWRASATLFHQQERELFQRQADIGDRVRKLTIKIMPEWLSAGDIFADESARELQRFTMQKLAARSWTPSHMLLALAEQIIKPPVFEPHLNRLYIESRVLGIISEAFSLLVDKRTAGHRPGLTASEAKRLRRAEEFLASSHEIPTVEAVAAAIGVSVNTLQRLFHAGHGTTVFNFVRMQRLDKARLALEDEGMSIAQAAYYAGYASPTNFATAFKRRHGFTPKQSRR